VTRFKSMLAALAASGLILAQPAAAADGGWFDDAPGAEPVVGLLGLVGLIFVIMAITDGDDFDDVPDSP
jgi:hypothetical protein